MIIEIKPYENKYRTGVVELLQYLWPWTEQERYERFNWEYVGNPSHPEPLAVVAVNEDDEVLGFRGWVPGIANSNGKRYLIARAADAVVSPKGRRQGIFTKMTFFSLEYLRNNGVDAILNLTSNEQSNPGNLKLGWQAIGKLNIWCNPVWPHVKKQLQDTVIIKKNGYQIELMPHIPYDLNIVTNAERIAFSMAEGQLGWLGKMPGNGFLTALTRKSDGTIDNVFVFGFGKGRKTPLYYMNVNEGKSGKTTFREACKFLSPGVISAWGMALDERNSTFLKKVGFIKIPFFEKIRKDPPILVRSVLDPEIDDGWLLEDKDIRDLNNWQLMIADLF